MGRVLEGVNRSYFEITVRLDQILREDIAFQQKGVVKSLSLANNVGAALFTDPTLRVDR